MENSENILQNVMEADNTIMQRQLNAALGCVFGAFIGDALGSAIEFKQVISREMLIDCLQMKGGVFGNGPGQVTDDSELAMCLLHGLSDTLPLYSPESVAKYYKAWVESHPFDIGNTCHASLGKLYGKSPPLANIALLAAISNNQQSKSNGSFMRSSPLAVWSYKLPIENIVELVHKESGFTHSNLTVKQAESFYIICMAHLIRCPGDKEGAITAANVYLESCNEEVKEWVNHSLSNSPMPGSPNIGYVKIAFDHAFRQLRKNEINFPECMAEVLSIGGDTDTNACIVGAMIGAYVGYDALPEEWKNKVENFDAKSAGGIERNTPCLDQKVVKEIVRRIFQEAPNEFREV